MSTGRGEEQDRVVILYGQPPLRSRRRSSQWWRRSQHDVNVDQRDVDHDRDDGDHLARQADGYGDEQSERRDKWTRRRCPRWRKTRTLVGCAPSTEVARSSALVPTFRMFTVLLAVSVMTVKPLTNLIAAVEIPTPAAPRPGPDSRQ
jgi:hypothetical protein